MACIRTLPDVIRIQEADIVESDVMDFREQAASAGYECKWGQPVQIATTSGGRNGRRVAMLVKHPTKCHILEDDDDPNNKYLRASGRWMECMVPVNDGGKHIIIASMYRV